MKRMIVWLQTVLLLCSLSLTAFAAAPSLSVDRTDYALTDTVAVSYDGTDDKDWIGIYPDGAAPGSMNALVWDYAVGTGTLSFKVASLRGAGTYGVYLCDNNGYQVLDFVTIEVSDGDTTDYGAAKAAVNASVTNGKSEISVTVTPACAEKLTYALYWARGNERLAGYRPIATAVHEGDEPFTVALNDCLFMPEDANGIEVAVDKGESTSVFAKAPSSLHIPSSKLLYEFQVITDMHISPDHPQHASNLTLALRDIAALSPNSEAIITVGDNTDRGTDEEYSLLLDAIDSAAVELPPIRYAMGNHDTVYSGTYAMQTARFKQYLGMESVYYAGDLGDTRFIVLGSDTQVGEGTMNGEQLAFLKDELAKTDSTKPVFVFLHQPLKDTVSGTLTALDPTVQDWYGFVGQTDELRAILKDHPNAILFSGHTHWSFEQTQPLLYGDGIDATFANAASVGYLWSDEDKAIGGSEGYYVEVYEDYVLLRGREYTSGEWCAAAQFLIPLNGGTAAILQQSAAPVLPLVIGIAALILLAAVILLVKRKKHA